MDTGKQETKVCNNLQKRAIRKTTTSETTAEIIKKIGGSVKPARAEMIASSPDHFGTSSKNIGNMEL